MAGEKVWCDGRGRCFGRISPVSVVHLTSGTLGRFVSAEPGRWTQEFHSFTKAVI